jgi:tetratricopeptide (TPR) repeat protein
MGNETNDPAEKKTPLALTPLALALECLEAGWSVEDTRQQLLQDGLTPQGAALVLRRALTQLGRTAEASKFQTRTGSGADFSQMACGVFGVACFAFAALLLFVGASTHQFRAAKFVASFLGLLGLASIRASAAPRTRRLVNEVEPAEPMASTPAWGLGSIVTVCLVLVGGLVGALYLANGLNQNDADRYVQAAREALERSDYSTAIAESNAALEIEPTSEGARVNRGTAYLHMGATAEALADFDAILRPEQPSSAWARYLAFYGRGTHLTNKKNYESAIGDLSAAINLYGDAERAAPRQQKLIELHEVYYRRAQAHLFSGHGTEALDDVNAALVLKDHPDYVVLRKKIQVLQSANAPR